MLAAAPLLLAAAAYAAPAAPTPAAAPEEVDTASMWRELEAHCAAGRCTLSTGARADESGADRWEANLKGPTGPATDCKGRLLAYEFGLKLLPSRRPQLESFDALELHTTCGVTRPTAPDRLAPPPLTIPSRGALFHVDPERGSDSAAAGDAAAPFRTIGRALAAARAASQPGAPRSIVLQPGTHFLNATIELGAADSGTTITAAPGAAPGSVVVSGGQLLKPSWSKSSRTAPNASGAQIWETAVPPALAKAGFKGLTTLSPHRRVTRAR